MGVGFRKVFVVNGPDVADYEDLVNLPAINSVLLLGNQTGDDLGLLDKALLDEPLGVPSLDAGTKLKIAEMPLATKEEAEGGTVETGLMTPLRTKQAIEAQIVAKEEAEAGTEATGIMTPLRTKEAIAAQVVVMTGATDADDGTIGLVPAPSAGDEGKVLTGDGTWKSPQHNKLSTTEYETPNTWIDGRPIFGIVVDFGALPDNDEKRVASGVPAGATVIGIKGYSKDATDDVATIQLTDSSLQVYHDDATQEVVILTTVDRSAYTETFVILEYIKAV